MPNVVVGLSLGLAKPAFGALIALRRDTLDTIGGFEAFRDTLADDYAMGAAVRALGREVRIPREMVMHAAAETSLADLWRHELRWARTVRNVDPAGFAGSVVTHPVPFACLGVALAGAAPASLAVLALALGSRLALQLTVPDNPLRVSAPRRYILAPLRDLLSFAVFVASFFGTRVEWGGTQLDVRKDGTMSASRNTTL
jgi:ceramide glucosyltransferase